ncbi:unnamed protein product (macronuclear) [Paramecium tetraurelia]|uniref:Uncharacterized protein n=1 Tax=Paramecium tetraurelia TaxID=5888 RepID=A0DIA5_PARTE|nr:uncharacterized protein GSPATT00017144001 [Paramecium tetraurelia]CAK82772.1 unnamed protein product [Paramecium tetraurelia]|eukprot:XP_001450169.1 hypothetical protein (macronuclear) [Paramecium tetraurelia strain d4-2]
MPILWKCVLLATDYQGQIVLVFCNGEIFTFSLVKEKDWQWTSSLKVIPQTSITQQEDYFLQLNGNGRKFFFSQVDQRYEMKIQIWQRGHKCNWTFQQSLKLYSRSKFLSINLSGSMLMVDHIRNILIWDYNHTQRKLARVQCVPLESTIASFHENESVIAAKSKQHVVFIKKINHMWVKYQSIKAEQEFFMQFFKNRLIIMTIYDLFMYKMDDSLHFQLEKQIISGIFTKEPQQCLFMGPIVMIQMPSLEIECYKYENNAWVKDKNYFNSNFQAHRIMYSKDYKKLFIYRKRYGGIVFEKKNEIKEKTKQ